LVTLGLQVVERAGGVKELVVTPGSTWANLLKAYFGPTNEKIEAAWLKCKNLLLNAKSAEDVAEFARCLAQEATK
jgi:hypothetical protein